MGEVPDYRHKYLKYKKKYCDLFRDISNDEDDDKYYNKYLKYKDLYINLKKDQMGGKYHFSQPNKGGVDSSENNEKLLYHHIAPQPLYQIGTNPYINIKGATTSI